MHPKRGGRIRSLVTHLSRLRARAHTPPRVQLFSKQSPNFWKVPEVRKVLRLKQQEKMVIAIAPAQHTSALQDTVIRLSSQTHGQDQRMDKSHPWNPANIVFTSDYDCTFTVKDTCELLVWAKQKALDISDDRLMAVYDALWEEYEKQLKAQIAANSEEHAQLGGDGIDVCEQLAVASSNKCECNVIMKMGNFVRMGLDPRLESAIRAYNDTEQSTTECASPEPLFGDSSNLRKMLKQLAKLESDINAKVIATGFLEGLRREEVRSAGIQATMQNACLEFLSRLTAVGTTVHVISANWSRDIIYGGLASLPEEQLFVHCNDLEYKVSGESSGYFENRVTSAINKESIQRAVRNLSNSQAASSNRTSSKMVVYFGDAQTDLLALLDADLGIVMGQRPALHKLMAQHGIKLLPLKDAAAVLSVRRLATFRQSGVLFQATGWQGVEACFFG